MASVHNPVQSFVLVPPQQPQINPAELEPVKAFLNSAFTLKLRGQPAQFNAIILQFRAKDDPETLWRVILALNSFTSQIMSR
jgi:hypothetical protein